MATFVHMTCTMRRATLNGNETKRKMKHPSALPVRPWRRPRAMRPGIAHEYACFYGAPVSFITYWDLLALCTQGELFFTSDRLHYCVIFLT